MILLLYLSWTPRESNIFLETVTGRVLTETATVSLDIFRNRQHVLEQHCENVNLTEIIPPRTLLYSRRLHLAYCPVYMAASSAMKYALLTAEGKPIVSHRLYNMSMKQAIHSDANKLSLKSHTEKVNGRVEVLLIVRDPWQRLVSAYRTLIENRSSLSHISSCVKTLGVKEPITFELFLQCIIKSWDTGVRLTSHLHPISQVCGICRIQYSRIGKTDYNVCCVICRFSFSSYGATRSLVLRFHVQIFHESAFIVVVLCSSSRSDFENFIRK